MSPRPKPLHEKFWSCVDKTPGFGPNGDCWRWTGNVNDRGYGRIFIGKPIRYAKAHRVSYEIAFGPIPERDDYHGTCICHRCDTPLCVNPAHLFAGSCGDNMRDRTAKGRQAHGPAHSLRMRGENSPRHILTEEQVLAIRADTRLQRVIAADYGIAASTVGNIQTGHSWRHIPFNPRRQGVFA